MVQWDCRWKRQNPQMTSSRSVSVVRSSEIYRTKVDIRYNHPGCPNHWSPQSLECRHQNDLTQPKHSQTDIIFAKTPLHVPNQHHFHYRASLHFNWEIQLLRNEKFRSLPCPSPEDSTLRTLRANLMTSTTKLPRFVSYWSWEVPRVPRGTKIYQMDTGPQRQEWGSLTKVMIL